MKCENCVYFYRDWLNDYDGEHPYCHWQARCPGDKAPCEEDEHNANLEGGDYE